jgi:uncharacterized protein YdaU (DUF1376 family)
LAWKESNLIAAVNYYERYPGDFQRDTGDLTLIEVGAYDRLLDHYYATEQPLSPDQKVIHRIARAMSVEEKKAVKLVISRYFFKGKDGFLHNARADEEIAKAERRIEAARTNGKRGGRPKKETQPKPSGIPSENPAGNPLGYPDHNPAPNPAESSPHAIHHTSPSDEGESRALARAEASASPPRTHSPPRRRGNGQPRTTIPADFDVSDEVTRWAEENAIENLDEHLEAFVLKCRKHGYEFADWDAAFIDAIRANWAGHGGEREESGNAGIGPWWRSTTGIDAMAKKLGLRVSPHQSYEDLKQLCFERLARGEAQ